MKKLIIQIPCLNEAESLPGTLRDLPHHADGWVVRLVKAFTYIGLGVFAAGTALSARLLYYYLLGDGAGQEARADASAEHR